MSPSPTRERYKSKGSYLNATASKLMKEAGNEHMKSQMALSVTQQNIASKMRSANSMSRLQAANHYQKNLLRSYGKREGESLQLGSQLQTSATIHASEATNVQLASPLQPGSVAVAPKPAARPQSATKTQARKLSAAGKERRERKPAPKHAFNPRGPENPEALEEPQAVYEKLDDHNLDQYVTPATDVGVALTY